MPAAKPEGYVLGRISSDLELYIVESFAQFERMSDLTTGALADVLNGGDNDEAIQNLIDLEPQRRPRAVLRQAAAYRDHAGA